MKKGTKYDEGKIQWDLMVWEPIEQIASIIDFGARKYAPNNWQKVSRERYKAALMRHLVAWFKGQKTDPESGKSHLAHAACNLVFLMWFERNM